MTSIILLTEIISIDRKVSKVPPTLKKGLYFIKPNATPCINLAFSTKFFILIGTVWS